MRIDVMVDLETLGTEPDSTIIQISAAAFDITTGDICATYDRIADISKNPSYEMTVSGETLKWWLNTDKQLLQELINRGTAGPTSGELVDDFQKWLSSINVMGDLHLWGNGILFDNLFLKQQMGENYPVRFTNDRDMRTIVDLMMTKTGLNYHELKQKYYDQELKAHDAKNDVLNQIALVTACYKELITN